MRASFHDYHSKSIYHLTLRKTPAASPFSVISTANGLVYAHPTVLGDAVADALRLLPTFHPSLRLLQYAIMPDHLHLLVEVGDRLPRPLGSYIGTLKVRITQRLRDTLGITSPILEPNFYDRILLPGQSLHSVYSYIRDNPRRLWVRRQHPEYFRRTGLLTLNGTRWYAYGNPDLLLNPFKVAVSIHRADTDAVKSYQRARWLHAAANGAVLVSPFISPDERQIRREAEDAGGKFIVLTPTAFGERFKPAAHDFELCEQGRLLLLAPPQSLPPNRSTFLWLNKWAHDIATDASL